MGYVIYIAATMLVVPLFSVLGEFFYRSSQARFFDLTWKWFIFWAIGIRLISAGRGIEHVNLKEGTALISDLWGFLIVVAYFLDSFFFRHKT